VLADEPVSAVLVNAQQQSPTAGYDLCLSLQQQLQTTVPIIMITDPLETAVPEGAANNWLIKPYDESNGMLGSLPSSS